MSDENITSIKRYKSLNSQVQDNKIDLSEFVQTNQDSEVDLSGAFSFSQHTPSRIFSDVDHKQSEKKRKQKQQQEDQNQNHMSYISYYRYPVKEKKIRSSKELLVIDNCMESSVSTELSKPQNHKKGYLYSNKLRRSFTSINTAKTNISTTNVNDENVFKRLQITKITKFFVLKIKQLSQKYNFRNLKQIHFDLIGDLASSQIYQNIQVITKSIFLQKQINIIFSTLVFNINKVIPSNPESLFFLIWNTIFSFIFLSYLFYIPFMYSFDIHSSLFESIIVTLLVIRFFISMVKGYYIKGELMLDKSKIIRNYFRFKFWIDSVIILSIYFQFGMYICYLNAPQVFKIIKQLLYHFQIFRKLQFVQDIVILLIGLALQIQLGACIFHQVGQSQIESHPEDNWLTQTGIDQSPWKDRYICSIYFAFTTLMNVVYGDIHAYNHAERFSVMVICMLSYITFGYFLTILGLILQEYTVYLEDYYKKRQNIINYMTQRSISSSNQIKMMHYLEYMFEKEQNNDKQSVQLIDEIPNNMKILLQKEFFNKLLSLNQKITNHFSQKLILELASTMKEITFNPGQIIQGEGSYINRIYFLIQGKVEVFFQNNKKSGVLQTYKIRGTDFCMKSAFTNQKIEYSIKSTQDQTATLGFFEFESFINILKKYPLDYESFCQWRDELILKEQQLTYLCKSCLNTDHELSECPMINLKLSKQKIIGSYLVELFQDRIKYTRKKFYYQTLLKNKLVSQKLKQYRIFLTNAVVPQMNENIEYLLQQSDEQFYKLMPPIKIINCNEDMIDEFSTERIQQSTDKEDEINHFKPNKAFPKRISLESIIEDIQNLSSSSTDSSSSQSDDESSLKQNMNKNSQLQIKTPNLNELQIVTNQEILNNVQTNNTGQMLNNQSQNNTEQSQSNYKLNRNIQTTNDQLETLVKQKVSNSQTSKQQQQTKESQRGQSSQAKHINLQIVKERLGRQKQELLTKQQQNLINMNTILEQKKRINNDPLKPNVPIQALKMRTDKMSSLYTKMLIREQQKQKRLKDLQLLWQKQQQEKPKKKNNYSKGFEANINTDEIIQIELTSLRKKNMIQNIFILDFDKCSQFKRYNTYYNSDRVIKRFNKLQQQIIRFNTENNIINQQKPLKLLFSTAQKSQKQ